MTKFATIFAAVLSVSLLSACQELTGKQPLPAGTLDPSTLNNAAGARQMAVGARSQFQYAFVDFIAQGGLITDELAAKTKGTLGINGAASDELVGMDTRQLLAIPNGGGAVANTYVLLQQTRTLINQSLGALSKYDPDSSALNRAELYALEGYAEVMLADLYCSGVPLSTSNFQHDFTYKPSSTTGDVYAHAMHLFDTAQTLAGNDPQIGTLANVGRGRALLAQGQYAAAASAVANVPVTFQYVDSVQICGDPTVSQCGSPGQAAFQAVTLGTVADSEGFVGLPYLSSGDPRSASTMVGLWHNNTQIWFPNKYSPNNVSAIILASGIEAQLIAAEAALHAGSASWLTILNALRTNGTQSGGTYNAGTGSVANLPPLTDPGTDTARVSMLFRERAFWLFLDGHRQGDLRRLVRNYDRSKDATYPSGHYPGVADGYSMFIDEPIPPSELNNPLFHGCLSRD